MAETLSFGFVKPETGDRGSTFFPALEDNIEQLNDHTHNGVDSSLLTAVSSTGVNQTIAAGSWSASGSGYKQTVTLPAGFSFDTTNISFQHSVSGYRIYPTVEKVTATTYDVYINDNTIALKAIYTT